MRISNITICLLSKYKLKIQNQNEVKLWIQELEELNIDNGILNLDQNIN